LFYHLEHGLVGHPLGHQHRHVAADGGEQRERLERLGGIPAREQLVEVQFRQEDRVAQIVIPGQCREELPNSPSTSLPPSVTVADSRNTAEASGRAWNPTPRTPNWSRNSSS